MIKLEFLTLKNYRGLANPASDKDLATFNKKGGRA